MKIKTRSRSIVIASAFLILFLICISSTALASTTKVSNSTSVATTEPYTFVTKWGSYGIEDGQFQYPYCIAVDSSGNVYVADTHNSRIQKFDSNGMFITKWGSYGSEDGQFTLPFSIAVDSSGNVYVTDYSNSLIQKFDSNGVFITKWGSPGNEDGQFSYPFGVAVDSSGNVYVVDSNNYRIQKFDSNGMFITKWGSYGSEDGQFSNPYGVAVDSSDNVYVVDYGNNRIQKFAQIETPEPSAPIYNPANGHYYEVKNVPGSITWEDANNAAQSSSYSDMKGHLATITSQNENEFIVNNFNMQPNYNWLGGLQPDGSAEPDGDWQWVTGEPWDYTNWNSGEPNDIGDIGEDKLHIYANGFWNDASDASTILNGYIIEYEQSAPAREITVDNSKANFTSIQEAVNNSVSGDTIIVKPGTYIENVLVNVPGLTIRSESDPGSVQVKPLDESKSTFMIEADSTTIIGLNIAGASQDFDKSAITLYSNMNNLTGNTIENGCILLGSERSDNLIAENKISNGGGEGIHISCCGSDTNTVSNNTISSCFIGIYEYDQAADIRNNRITDCTYGIELAQASSVIDNNIILNCGVGILLGESCHVDIVNNTIMSCEECGIFDQDKFGDRIYNNYFNNSLNVKFGDNVGEGDIWNTSLTQGTNIAGGPYIGGNFWAKPDGTGFSQTSVDMDGNGIGDLPYNIYEDEFDYLPLVFLPIPHPVIPTANFIASVTDGTAPLLVQFTDLSENAIEWKWDFGDGTNSREQNPVHTYSTAGNYTVNLTASNIDGIDSKLSTITVFGPVHPAEPSASNATNAYAPVNVQIGNLSQNANEINWNIGSQQFDTNFNGKGQNISAPVTVQIDNASQNAITINWNIHA